MAGLDPARPVKAGAPSAAAGTASLVTAGAPSVAAGIASLVTAGLDPAIDGQ
jgi:hypothetical protein